MSFGKLKDGVHIGGKTEEMDRHNGSSARSDGRFNSLRIDVESDGIDVNEDRLGTDIGDGARGGDETKRCGDHFVAGPDLRSKQGEDQSICARGATDSVCGAEFGGDFLLEFFNFGAEDEVLRIHDAGDGSHDFVANGSELGPEIEEVKKRFHGCRLLLVDRG